MCIVIDLRETELVSQVNLRLHTMLPTVRDYSTLVSGGRSEVGELPGGCLLTEVGEQTTSLNETVDGNRERWGGHRSYGTQD